MNNVYILSDKGKLSKEGNHLLFSDINGNRQTIFPFLTKIIFCEKPISISAEAFLIIANNHIQLFFNSYNSSSNFNFSYIQNNDIQLKHNQYALLDNLSLRLKLAKSIVIGKLKNQLFFMQRINRTKCKNTPEISINISKLSSLIVKIETCHDLDTLRGYEGIAAKYYFAVLRTNIKPTWAKFDNRTYNPPKSNVNAVLSYLYTLLTCKITAFLQGLGFETLIGIFHNYSYGKNVLAFDLVEEFRTSIADTLCCKLFNKDIIKEEDFIEHNDGIYLTKEGKAKVISHYEKKLSEQKFYKPANKVVTYNEIIEKQCKLLKSVLLSKEKIYISFEMR